MRYMMIVLLEFYPSWLALPREERRKHARALQATIQKYSEHVQVRFLMQKHCLERTTPISSYAKRRT